MLKAIILLGFACLIAWLVKGERLSYYIAPHMAIGVKLSAYVFYATGIWELYVAWKKRQRKETITCSCGHDDHWHDDADDDHHLWHQHVPAHTHTLNKSPRSNRQLLVFTLFLLPLLLGFVLPDAALDAQMAAQKGMNLASAQSLRKDDFGKSPVNTTPVDRSNGAGQSETIPIVPNVQDPLFPTDAFNESYAKLGRLLYEQPMIEVKPALFTEILTTLDLFMQTFKGKQVQMSGFVYREDGLSTQQFVIGRFAVQCCTADAAPYGVLVEWKDAPVLADNTWVEVTGVIDPTIYKGMDMLRIRAHAVRTIPAPKEPYVYPNFDFDPDQPDPELFPKKSQ